MAFGTQLVWPDVYGSNDNRLMYCEVEDITNPGSPVLLDEVWYYYDRRGNVRRIVRTTPAGPNDLLAYA